MPPTPTPTPSGTPIPSPTASPTASPCDTILWYNGDGHANSGLANAINGDFSDAHIFADFAVTDAGGWNVTAVFSNNVMNFTTAMAAYEIRSGVSTGNGGTLLFSGTAPATQVLTGRVPFEFTMRISGLNIFLPPGTYHLNVAPIGKGTGGSFNSVTVGANAVGSPPGNNGNEFFRSTEFGANYVLTDDPSIMSGRDFSNGVIGTVVGSPCATPTPSPTIPPTATPTPTPSPR